MGNLFLYRSYRCFSDLGNDMSNEEKKRGGFREGSGRKPTGRLKQFANTTISGTPEEIELLKSKAKEAGKTVSRFVIEKILSE